MIKFYAQSISPTRNILFETHRTVAAEAVSDDIANIIALEEDPENRDFLWVGTMDEHLEEISDPNHILMLFLEKNDGHILGYALVRLNPKSEIFELRRIAINEKNRGYGTETMQGLFSYAFEILHINRFWLDVYPDNIGGIHLYEALGMHRDGVLRQNYKAKRGYLDQIIYSMLRWEYFQKQE